MFGQHHVHEIPIVAAVEWMVSLHDDLLAGRTGRHFNGIGGAVILFLSISGLVLWWSGRSSWKRGLYVPLRSPRKLWHLHSAAGFWFWLLLLNWSVTAMAGMPSSTLPMWASSTSRASVPSGQSLSEWKRTRLP